MAVMHIYKFIKKTERPYERTDFRMVSLIYCTKQPGDFCPPVIFYQNRPDLLFIFFLPEDLSSKKSEYRGDCYPKDDEHKLDWFVISRVWSMLILDVYRLSITVDVGVIRKNGSIFRKDMRNSYISSFFTLKIVPTTFGPALEATAAPIWK